MSGGRPEFRAETVGGRYRRFRLAVLRSTEVCCICGGTVDRTVPPRHPRAPSLEHKISLKLGGQAMDWENAGVAHYGCNSSRGDGTSRSNRRNGHHGTSESW